MSNTKGFYTKTKNGNTAHVLADENAIKVIHKMIDIAYTKKLSASAEKDKKFTEKILAEMGKIKVIYDNPHLDVTVPASPQALLLDFCHFIGREGYKINGYDDGQLNAVIEKFLNIS